MVFVGILADLVGTLGYDDLIGTLGYIYDLVGTLGYDDLIGTLASFSLRSVFTSFTS